MPHNALLAPSWAGGRLPVCGFTTRHHGGPEAVENVRQDHGSVVHVLRRDRGPEPPDAPDVGDGLWTDRPGLVIGVRVADCVPILLWEPHANAVAAIHAGWRGTAAGIVAAAVDAGADLGAQPGRLWAAIGPCISAAHYEVGDEVVAGLRSVGLRDDEFGLTDGPRARAHVDLRLAVRSLLVRAGLDDARIDDVGGCTFSQPELLHSFRREGAIGGRLRGVIGLPAS